MSNILLDAFYSLGRNLNKMRGQDSTETEEGIVSPKFPELTLKMSNEDLIKLTEGWNKNWMESAVYSDWFKLSQENENYWKGKHFQRPDVDRRRAIVDNVIFEALETYLPQVTRRNPEPMVTLANSEPQSPENLAYATKLKKELGEIADEVVLRLKLKKMARHWAIFLVGAIKSGWDMNKKIPTVKVIRAAKLILDPDATVDEDGYTGKYIGEHRKLEASVLIKILEEIDHEPEALKFINDMAKDDLGTELGFIEWWTDDYLCWTMGKQVLFKSKNPHWNYEKEVPMQSDESGQVPQGEDGQPQTQTMPGFNHLPRPTMPYRLLSVFNLGTRPIDETSLIGQNLANQDLINKRIKQIDKNADSMNGGMIVSGANSGLTKEQAKGVTEALRKGGTVYIATGTPDEAIKRDVAPALPETIYGQLVDVRARTRDIFGTAGITPTSLQKDRTVGGKILTQQVDTDRIGGGFSEYLEQAADGIYNYTIQMLYVYNPEFSNPMMPVAADPNNPQAPRQVPKPKVKASVKEGSLLPKDSTTLANQAIELAGSNRMSLLDMFKALDYPNPEELAANVWLQENAPEVLLKNDPRIAQVLQQKQEAAAKAGTGQKPPSTSINFKDLPPDGQAQLAKAAGIELHPEAIAVHDIHKEQRAAESSRASKEMQPAAQ